jgi:hypothetical protein
MPPVSRAFVLSMCIIPGFVSHNWSARPVLSCALCAIPAGLFICLLYRKRKSHVTNQD